LHRPERGDVDDIQRAVERHAEHLDLCQLEPWRAAWPPIGLALHERDLAFLPGDRRLRLRYYEVAVERPLGRVQSAAQPGLFREPRMSCELIAAETRKQETQIGLQV